MGITSDRNDPRLTHGADDQPRPQADAYLVLSEAERAKGFVRPLRLTYKHVGLVTIAGGEMRVCGGVTTMNQAIAETYAREPHFYGGTYCVRCEMHRPVGERGEFVWLEQDGSTGPKVGT